MKKLIAAIAIALMLMPVASAGNTWFICRKSSGLVVPYTYLNMGDDDGTEGTVAVDKVFGTVYNDTVGASASVDLSGVWVAHIWFGVLSDGEATITVEIGNYSQNELGGWTFDSFGSATTTKSFTITYPDYINIPVTTTDHIVNEGDRVAVRITYTTDIFTNIDLYVKTNGFSYIQSTSTTPDFPVPELSSLFLMLGGICVAMPIMAKKRK